MQLVILDPRRHRHVRPRMHERHDRGFFEGDLLGLAINVEPLRIVEFALPAPAGLTRENKVTAMFDNRVPIVASNDGKVVRFRFSPKAAKVWPYTIRSDFAGLDGTAGALRAVVPPRERTRVPAASHPNWWIDDPDPAAAEGMLAGAKSVSRWREDFLRDFAGRMKRVD